MKAIARLANCSRPDMSGQVGIPYPPLMDIRVRLKRQHNDAHAALLGSGSTWYAAEAFRAVNQAVGTPETSFQRSRAHLAFRSTPSIAHQFDHDLDRFLSLSIALMSKLNQSIVRFHQET